MYRLLEKIRPARKTAGTRQEQPPRSGRPAEGVCRRCGGYNHRPLLGGQWPAQGHETPHEDVAFRALYRDLGYVTIDYGCTGVRLGPLLALFLESLYYRTCLSSGWSEPPGYGQRRLAADKRYLRNHEASNLTGVPQSSIRQA